MSSSSMLASPCWRRRRRCTNTNATMPHTTTAARTEPSVVNKDEFDDGDALKVTMDSGAVDGDAGESCTLVGGAVSNLPFSRGPNGVKVSTGVAGTVLIPIEPPVERPSLGVDPDVGEARTELGVTMGMLFDDEAGGGDVGGSSDGTSVG
ncbi:hypothetical protein H257_01678 [Aphanomyces astaci]|uniref:Uncharacterized protein n=1 Tax=Aphanomyces astaci TaxID=112090 RepID=W4H5U7_APHAT|nr:hypothetical protein H257_01678 [Aphanomyces astaci]ETV86498.1 hypothetical protein H257_01678 [Aphanomyces astaci]|eukprot:XP_009823297.1 hypothetical protein H257_01678 [Aphanomyces astaci]